MYLAESKMSYLATASNIAWSSGTVIALVIAAFIGMYRIGRKQAKAAGEVSTALAVLATEMSNVKGDVSAVKTTLSDRNGGSSVRDQLVFILDEVKAGNQRMDRHLEDHPAPTKRVRKV